MRNKSIDGLRGVLALLIIIFHYLCRFNQLYLDSDIWYLRYLGVLGGETFMILSCFFLATDVDDFKLWNFLKKRFIRLYPTYLIAITIIMVFLCIFNLPGRTVSIKDYFLNVFMLSGYVGTPYVDSAHWYIFTLVSATVIVGIFNRLHISHSIYTYISWMLIGYLLIRLFSLQISNVIYNVLGGSYIGIISSGVALKKIFDIEGLSIHKHNMWKWMAVIVAGMSYTYLVKDTSSALLILPSMAIIWSVSKYKFKFLQNKMLLGIGTISYPLYLLHQNIGYSIEYALVTKYGEQYLFGFAFIAFCVVLLISIFIDYFIKIVIPHSN